jgi:proline iminopeptidase
LNPVMVCAAQEKLRTLYNSPPQIASGNLAVDEVHTIHYRIYGNAEAEKTALFLHGGPGAGCFPNHARFFDPERWRVVLFDQRGCGSSTPKGCEVNNDTPHLISDIELLRKEIDGGPNGQVQAWDVVLGGSWGVTLALAYAQRHPERVKGIILRGVCTMRAKVSYQRVAHTLIQKK